MEYNEVKRIVDLENTVRELEIKIEQIQRGIGNINLSITTGETIGEINNTYIDNTYEKLIGKPITKIADREAEPLSCSVFDPSSKPFV